MSDLLTQAAAPSRRRFLLFLAMMNATITVMDALLSAPHLALAVGARATLSLAFVGAALVLGRTSSAAAASRVVRVLGVATGLLFSAVCWATDGLAGFNGAMAAFMPLVLFIAVPDDPIALLLCGATMFLASLPWVEGPHGAPLVIWTLGIGSITVYAAVGARLFREQLFARLALEREREVTRARVAELERRAEMDDRLALLGRLVAGVAHEVRNPLAWVTMNVSLLKDTADTRSTEVRETLADVEAGLERIRQIIEDLRTFSRDEVGAVQPCDVAGVLDEALRIASARVRQVARVERVLPALPKVDGEARRLMQVFLNLLVNAADAIEGSGHTPGLLRVTARAEGEHVIIDIEDNGSGLSAQARERLFEPFHTTKGPEGTGLGLSMSRQWVRGFGGDLVAGESTLGGARFELTLRRSPTAQA
jgi:signal transduction histidine kinase